MGSPPSSILESPTYFLPHMEIILPSSILGSPPSSHLRRAIPLFHIGSPLLFHIRLSTQGDHPPSSILGSPPSSIKGSNLSSILGSPILFHIWLPIHREIILPSSIFGSPTSSLLHREISSPLLYLIGLPHGRSYSLLQYCDPLRLIPVRIFFLQTGRSTSPSNAPNWDTLPLPNLKLRSFCPLTYRILFLQTLICRSSSLPYSSHRG
jgi:hypothetical protein